MHEKSKLDSARRLGSSLDRHLYRVDVFKIGLRNSFAIDFRSASRLVQSDDGQSRSERFHYLGEVFPFIETRVKSLKKKRRRAYESLKERATESFWQIYSDFQPLLQAVAESSGVDADRLSPVLGRAILLFDASRRTKFVTYLEKTLRESVKNLRGESYASQLGLPLSAGRLVPQMQWVLDRAAMESGQKLSPEESDAVVINFLSQHRSKFSDDSMRRIAEVIRRGRQNVSLDIYRNWLEPSANEHSRAAGPGNDCVVEEHEEYQFQLMQIHAAIGRAGFDADEACLVLHRLDLPHDPRRFDRMSSLVTATSLRKRATRLLVRLMAAKYAPQAPTFGEFLDGGPAESRQDLRETLAACSRQRELSCDVLIDELLNWMSLSDSVYRVSISQRGKVAEYLSPESETDLTSATFQKLKAALIEQERLDFPLLDSLLSHVAIDDTVAKLAEPRALRK